MNPFKPIDDFLRWIYTEEDVQKSGKQKFLENLVAGSVGLSIIVGIWITILVYGDSPKSPLPQQFQDRITIWRAELSYHAASITPSTWENLNKTIHKAD